MILLELNTDYRKNFWNSYTMISKSLHPWFWFMSWSSDKCLFIYLKTTCFSEQLFRALVYLRTIFFFFFADLHTSYIENNFVTKFLFHTFSFLWKFCWWYSIMYGFFCCFTEEIWKGPEFCNVEIFLLSKYIWIFL